MVENKLTSKNFSMVESLFTPVHILPIEGGLESSNPTFGLVYKIEQSSMSRQLSYKGLALTEELEELIAPQAVFNDVNKSPLIIDNESVIAGFSEFSVYTQQELH